MPHQSPEFLLEFVSLYNFAQTVDRLRHAIQDAGFLLLHEIDTQTVVKAHGLEIDGLRQLLFFHPRYIKTILEHNNAAIVEAPLKLIVMETEAGVVVRCAKPSYLFGRYGLQDLGQELELLVTTIVGVVLGDKSA
jgi:uncharacterized protein (DUF302 family)